MIDINTGLIAVICLLLLIQYFKSSGEKERIRTIVTDTVRSERERCKIANAYAFELYKTALKEAWKDAKSSD